MSRFTDGIVEQYLNQDPERRKAYALDPQTHYQTELLRRMLETTERAMEDEGVPAETRARVLRAVVYGDAESGMAERRMARDEARDLLLARFDPSEFARLASPVFTKPGPSAERLADDTSPERMTAWLEKEQERLRKATGCDLSAQPDTTEEA